MKLMILIALLLPASTVSMAAEETAWTWSGLEILGNHSVDRSLIEKSIPIPIGGVWRRGDPAFWSASCAEVKSRFDFASVDCGNVPLRVYDGRKAYLIVDIVEKGRERLLKFREAPAGTVPFANDEMLTLSADIMARATTASMAGHPYSESGSKGYLSYEDPNGMNESLAPQVERLAQIVPAHLKNIFSVLRDEKDKEKRRQAANLLCWSGGDLERTLRLTLPLLDDPDEGVRNNLSRFMIQFVGSVKSARLRHRLIEAFVLQIQRPSHGDRNKGLYNLLGIANAWPDDRAFILSHGGGPIRYIADNSIIFNVQGPARDLMALIETAAPPSLKE